jgi:ATP-dependent Lhr-like helicase
VRWRWNATTSLALPRFVGGNRVAPQLQRMKSEDLLASVFPDQVACAENLVGERQIPDHPLVAQTLHDCLHEAMDIEGLERLLRALEAGEARIVARDLTEPSPLAAEVLGARPYAYLDDAPLEERRTQAVMSRRFDPQSASDLGRLSPDAIDAVRAEAWPEAGSADEMHAVLLDIGFVTDDDVRRVSHWPGLLQRLARDGRATCFLSLLPLGEGGHRPDEGSAKSEALRVDRTLSRPFGAPSPDGRGESKKASGEVTVGTSACPIAIWVAAERLPQFDALFGAAQRDPAIVAPAEFAAVAWTPEDALVDIVRARLTALGPVPAAAIAASLALPGGELDVALLRLESEGYVMRGHFTPGADEIEWCERHQLSRIHRYTLQRLRREIEPVEARDFMRFLFEWQRVAADVQVAGPDALANVIAQLE